MPTAASTTEPSPWIRRFAPLISSGGSVIDIACGGGRHSAYLAGLGHRVTAVDRDTDRVTRIANTVGHDRIEVIHADLENGDWPFAQRRFDAIVVANYLHRPQLPWLAPALTTGGVLLFDTFAVGNERFGRPRDPAFLLRPGELLEAFGDHLQIVAYEHGLVDEPTPAMRQRLCAVRVGIEA